MQIMLIFSLVIAALAILFAVQNNTTVTISFLAWKTEAPQALVLLIALAAGAVISLLASLPSITRHKLTIRSQRKKVSELETSLTDHKGQLDEARKQLQTQENQKATAQVEEATSKPVDP